MKHKGLVEVLKDIGINLAKPRIEFMSMLILGIVEAKTVNLKKVVSKIQSWAKEDSVYRRAQRFFTEVELDHLSYTKVMVSLLGKSSYELCIDRTNWKLGQFNINIMMIAVVDAGVAIPLAFELLEKRGNSNTAERIDLLEQVLEVIEAKQITNFLGDREFIGQDWFAFLEEKNIPFAIRIKENNLVDQWFRLSMFFTKLEAGQKQYLHHRYTICGCQLSVAATRSSNNQLVIIVTNRKPSWALETYAQRWQIESLFKALKSSGFNLEDTHLKDIYKLDALIALVSLAFIWALKVGHSIHMKKPIRIKSHGRREKSIFRLGLDSISRAITNFTFQPKLLNDAFRLLSCT